MFSGPIRSAGTTASCMVLMLIDYLRETFGYAKYDPDENEVKRYVTENYDYHERVTNLQYLPTEEEIYYLASHMPIEISGEPSEEREVSNYKDLQRVDTNRIRGGMCLIFSEGLAQKAQKGLRLYKGAQEKGFKMGGWNFLSEFVDKFKKKSKAGAGDNVPVYIKDLVAGRPVYGHPSRQGSFRFRYGRTRTSGFSATAVHPATMAVSDSFLSFGNQLKIEKPTKGCVVGVTDEIDGPIVKLKNGSIKRMWDYEEVRKNYKEIEEIIYLGDILVSFGDVANRNYEMLKPAYVEEWWYLQLKKAVPEIKIDFHNVSFEEAVKFSLEYKIPLYPRHIYYWNAINYEQFLGLLDWLARAKIWNKEVILPFARHDKERFAKGKRALELIGCEHEASIENVIIKGNDARAFLFNLGIEFIEGSLETEVDKVILGLKDLQEANVLNAVNKLSKATIKDKLGTFIGARMGRPEKSKLRKLTGSPHAIFPVGEEGGRLRSFQSAVEIGSVYADFALYYCDSCKKESIYPKCELCGNFNKKMMYSPAEDRNYVEENPIEGGGFKYKKKRIDIRHYFESAKKMLQLRNEEIPIVKGVRGTSNKDHSVEPLAKGLLRAKHNLNVNKDGTIRYDMTEMAITHFKPKEIGTSVEKLRGLGYEKDCCGQLLVDENQILELFPHDVILPACPESGDEKADDVFLRISRFVDDELEKIYGLPRYFNAKDKNDLIGQLIVCIAPHICNESVGRLIGFSKTQTLLASPFMHAAMRRDCLGAESYIPICENEKWRIEKISNFVNSYNPVKKSDNFGTLSQEIKGVKIWSNPGQKEICEVSKHSPYDFLKIYLEDGRKLEMTENHKLYAKGKKEIKAGDLREGDKLMVSYKKDIPEIDIENLFLPEIFDGRQDIMIKGVREFLKANKHSNFGFRDSFPLKEVKEKLLKNGRGLRDLPLSAKISIKRDKIDLPVNIKLSNDLLAVFGLYISEGYSRKGKGKKGFYQVSFTGKLIKEFIRRTMLESFGLSPSWENEDSVTFSSRIVYELFTNYLKMGGKAKEKRIPSLFLNLKKEKIAHLLRGYYEGDGSASLSDIRVSCDSVSEGLRHDLSFILSRFGILTKYYEYEKEPGPAVKAFYIRKGKPIPKFRITKIIILSNFVKKFRDNIGFLFEKKNEILDELCKGSPYGTKIDFDESYAYPKIVKIEKLGQKESYCLNVAEEHNFFANDILVHNCDGDEAASMLLMDMLLNFSRKFLPAHRGGTQDSPLVLNVQIRAGDVDDQILDFETSLYPLELYEMAEQGKHSSEMKGIENIKQRLKNGIDPFTNICFSHGCEDINKTILNSSYKSLPTMQEKVERMMGLCKKLRSVDVSDVARLVIERHFIRDTKGNLRKFSQQVFRCVECNSKYRRPPIAGKCTKCAGRLIFTISEGSILKYMQPALDLAKNFKVSPYLLESLELNQMYIESIFGREKEKQESIAKWF